MLKKSLPYYIHVYALIIRIALIIIICMKLCMTNLFISLQISYISNSVGDTIVQLNRPDCLFKLSIDLQYLFIYRPTTMHTMTLSELEGLYAECYGHRLSSAVYGSPTVELLFDHKQVKSLVKVRIDFTHTHSGTCTYKHILCA